MGAISYNDFQKLDLRVVTVTAAERIPDKTKILKLSVDIGSGTQRTMIAGGAEYYDPKAFVNKQFVAVLNLIPKTIAGVRSQGMLLAADVDGKPCWVTVEGAPTGARIR
jgi:tRNA-binding protein